MFPTRLLPLLVAVCTTIAWLHSEQTRADEKKSQKTGTVSGVATAKAGNWLEVKADGEEKARRYFTGSDQAAQKAVKATEVGSRVRLEWRFQEVFRVVKIEVLKEGKSTDQEKIQGTWTVESAERNGKAVAAETAKNIKLIFAGDKFTLQNRDRKNEFKFKLNPDKKPKEIDVDMDGSVGLGIYELVGDNLKIIHGEVGDKRPTEFVSKPDSGLTLLVLKREKK